MTYVIVVSLFLGLGAWAAERAARLRHASTRWIWALAVGSSLLMPTVIASVSIQIPNIFSPTSPPVATSPPAVALRDATSRYLAPQRLFTGSVQSPAVRATLDSRLKTAWLTVSVAMWAGLIANGLYVFTRRRRWSTGTLAGISVYVAPDTGPAVVGLLRPTIVVPQWLMTAPPAQQSAVMAHEQSHVRAGDTQLFTATLFLLILMPWNFPLWWQLHRLRRAIEVDCDRRVLDAGCDVAAYGETLIAVGERRSRYVGTVAAMSESKSFLEQRLTIMTNTPGRGRLATIIALSCLSATLVAVAAQVSPPDAAGKGGPPHQRSQQDQTPQEITVDPGVLARYVGSYKLADSAVLAVTLDGRQLKAQLTGQSAFPIYASSPTEFFYKVVDAQITFLDDSTGQAASLVLHQYGKDMPMPRIDDSEAAQMAASRAAKVQSQTPTPGAEAALRRYIAAIASGKPNYDEMSTELADATREQLPAAQAAISGLGPVQSIQFLGVGNLGWDVYSVKQERGSMQWRIALGSDGKIVGALASAGP
jgi:beta-lactamase regulating signal transducer with metallopeptidase domain